MGTNTASDLNFGWWLACEGFWGKRFSNGLEKTWVAFFHSQWRLIISQPSCSVRANEWYSFLNFQVRKGIRFQGKISPFPKKEDECDAMDMLEQIQWSFSSTSKLFMNIFLIAGRPHTSDHHSRNLGVLKSIPRQVVLLSLILFFISDVWDKLHKRSSTSSKLITARTSRFRNKQQL